MLTHEITKRDSYKKIITRSCFFHSWFAQDGKVDCGPTSSQSNSRLFPSGITIRISFRHGGVGLADHKWQAWNLLAQLRSNPDKTDSARKLASPNLTHIQKNITEQQALASQFTSIQNTLIPINRMVLLSFLNYMNPFLDLLTDARFKWFKVF